MNSMRSIAVLFLFLVAFSCIPVLPARAASHAERAKLLQMIEILRHEISLLGILIGNMQAAASQPSQISAHSYIAVDLTDKTTLLHKNAAQRHSIASITKLMAALVATEHIDKNRTITLTASILKPLGASPSLYQGLTISADNLLKASLIQSANDATEALAYMVGAEEFTSRMNQKAAELGMASTVFFDAHGLNPQNRSTAADLAKLVAYIYKNHPALLQTTKENDFWLADQTGRLLKFQNVNNFYPLANFLGGKTGYLPQARQTIAAVFSANGRPTAVIVLNSANRQADTFRILNQLD